MKLSKEVESCEVKLHKLHIACQMDSWWRLDARFESEEGYKIFMIFFLWFILLHHKSLFDSCNPYRLTHVNNSFSKDIVILIVCWFLLWYISITNRNMPPQKYTMDDPYKKNDEKLHSFKCDLVSDLKKEIMNDVKAKVKKTRKSKFWSHKLLYCRIMWL